jgi:hypothetical protein
MCLRPSITYYCCSRPIIWGESGDRYVDPKWRPPIVEWCSKDDKGRRRHLVLYRDFGATWWSTFPVACADCERKVIKTQQSEDDVRARIDARLTRFAKTSSCLEPRGRARVLHFTKIFFRSAFKKRLDQGNYRLNARHRVRAWQAMIEKWNCALPGTKGDALLVPGIPGLNMWQLREEAASHWREIKADTVEFADNLMGKWWAEQNGIGENGGEDILGLYRPSATVLRLQQKYFTSADEQVNEDDNELAWIVPEVHYNLDLRDLFKEVRRQR